MGQLCQLQLPFFQNFCYTRSMKKYLTLVTTALILTACGQGQQTTDSSSASSQTATAQTATSSSTEMTYKDYTAVLTPISFDELAQKMANGEDFVLFLGRETCQYCNIFVPKLHQVLTEKPATVYYYNTEDASDQNLQAFRDKFGIKTVPNLSYYQGDQLVATLEKGSQSTPEEIAALLNLQGN